MVALFLLLTPEFLIAIVRKNKKMTDLAYIVNQMKWCKTQEDLMRAKNRLERRRIAFEKCVRKVLVAERKRHTLFHYILYNLKTFFGVLK